MLSSPCHEVHVLAASISSPRLYRSLFPSTFKIRKVKLQLLIRCASYNCLPICRTPVVYSSDLRHGENPVPRCTSTPDQPTLLLQFSIPSLYSRDLTCDAQSKKTFKGTLTRHVSGTEGYVRSGRPHLLKDRALTACEALHVIQLVQCTSATVPVYYANVVCPRGDHTQLSAY